MLADLGNFCLKYWSTKEELKTEFELYLPLLKEKHKFDRRQALRELNSEFKERFTEWCNHHNNLGYNSQLSQRLKFERDLLKFCKTMDQIADLKRNLSGETDTINILMKQSDRSSKVKSSCQTLQEVKTNLDKT